MENGWENRRILCDGISRWIRFVIHHKSIWLNWSLATGLLLIEADSSLEKLRYSILLSFFISIFPLLVWGVHLIIARQFPSRDSTRINELADVIATWTPSLAYLLVIGIKKFQLSGSMSWSHILWELLPVLLLAMAGWITPATVDLVGRKYKSIPDIYKKILDEIRKIIGWIPFCALLFLFLLSFDATSFYTIQLVKEPDILSQQAIGFLVIQYSIAILIPISYFLRKPMKHFLASNPAWIWLVLPVYPLIKITAFHASDMGLSPFSQHSVQMVLMFLVLYFALHGQAFHEYLIRPVWREISSSSQLKWRVMCLAPLSLLFFSLLLQFWNFTIDDAYISYRYSLNFINGHGILWNPGLPPVEGYTNFLWIIVNAIGLSLGLNPLLFSRIISIATVMGIAVLMDKIACKYGLSRLNRLGLIFILATSELIAIHALSGMETIGFMGLLGLALYLALWFLPEAKTASMVKLFTSLLALSLIRPEGIGISFLLGLLLFVFLKKRRLLFLGLGFLIYIFPFLMYQVWRVSYYGYWFPNTYYIKAASGIDFDRMMVQLLAEAPFFASISIPLIMFVFGFLSCEKQRKTLLHLGIISIPVLLLVPYYFNSSLTMNVEHRFYVPLLICIFFGCTIGTASLSRYLHISSSHTKNVVITTVLLISVLGNMSIVSEHYKKSAFQYGHKMNQSMMQLGQILGEQLNPNDMVAVGDAGEFPYYRNGHFLDYLKLNSAYLAHHPNPKYNFEVDIDWILQQKPTAFYLVSPKPWEIQEYEVGIRRVSYEIWRHEHMRKYECIASNGSGEYHRLIMFRRDDPRIDRVREALKKWNTHSVDGKKLPSNDVD